MLIRQPRQLKTLVGIPTLYALHVTTIRMVTYRPVPNVILKHIYHLSKIQGVMPATQVIHLWWSAIPKIRQMLSVQVVMLMSATSYRIAIINMLFLNAPIAMPISTAIFRCARSAMGRNRIQKHCLRNSAVVMIVTEIRIL